MKILIEWILKIIRYILKIFNNLVFPQQKQTETQENETIIQRFEFSELEYLSNQYSNRNENKSQLKMIPVSDELKSRWESMRLKKHFTFQTNVLLKPNQPTYVGAFSSSTELQTVKRSPFSYLPFLRDLFSRKEFILIKSAILEMSLKNKVVLITGASSGIGLQSAIKCSNEGAKIVCVDLRETEDLKKIKGDYYFISCDVSKAKSVKETIQKAVEKYGKIDCCFNNAGIGGNLGKIHEQDEFTLDKLMEINLKGVFLCLKYEIEQMLKQPKLKNNESYSIVNNSSISGLVGFKMNAPYSATKFGVVGMTYSTSLEYARKGIRINAVCPSFTRTPLVTKLMTEQEFEALKNRVPMGRVANPEEVADSVVFLLSKKSSFITGVALPIDGGISAI
eukprot:gene3923-7134_t